MSKFRLWTILLCSAFCGSFSATVEEKAQGLFDKEFYARLYQVEEEGAYEHYNQPGSGDNRPNYWFDPSYHLKDVDLMSSANPLVSYVAHLEKKEAESKRRKWDYVVVGSGFSGATAARKLAESEKSVLVIEKRPDVGGNAYDYYDAYGVLIHCYGPHIFHTNDKGVLEFLSEFTKWHFYEHRVQSLVEGALYPIPINRTTLNKLYRLNLETEEDCQNYYDSVKKPCAEVRNSEDVVLSVVGEDLCDKFFRNYTAKQWGGRDLKDLDPSVLRRIPTRTNTDDRYFADTYQFMPADGYTKMFREMLQHPNITLLPSTDFDALRDDLQYDHLIYTGPIDQYYKFVHGPLPYRSIKFEFEHLGKKYFQPTGTVNYPNDEAFTRITEFKRLTGQDHGGTTILREYPQEVNETDEPFYPILSSETNDALEAYQKKAAGDDRVSFLGRLAEFRYYNMDQAVRAALDLTGKLLVKE